MEFLFDVRSLFPRSIIRLVAGMLPGSAEENHSNRLQIIVDEMGRASAQAQDLRAPITTYQKVVASNHTLYIMTDRGGQRGSVVGILKVGRKRLFLTDFCGLVHEVEPLCVLDFYIHESCQRCGYGKQLFEEMLKMENLQPFEVAIDRPSPKFLSFLKKHYKLSSFVQQGNNYVVFNEFFSTCKEVRPKSRLFTFSSGASPTIGTGSWTYRLNMSRQNRNRPKENPIPTSARLTSGRTHLEVPSQNKPWPPNKSSSPFPTLRSGTPLSRVSTQMRKSTLNNPFSPIRVPSGNYFQVPSRHRRWTDDKPSSPSPASRFRTPLPSVLPQKRQSVNKPSPLSLFAIHAPSQSQSKTGASLDVRADHSSRPKQTVTFSLSPKPGDFGIINGQSKKEIHDRSQSGRSRRLSDSQEPFGGASVQQNSEAERAFPDKAPHLNMRCNRRRASWKTPLGAINEQSSTSESQLAKYSHHTRIQSDARKTSNTGAKATDTNSPGARPTSTGTRITDSTGAVITGNPGVRKTGSMHTGMKNTGNKKTGSTGTKNTESTGAKNTSTGSTGAKNTGSTGAKNTRSTDAKITGSTGAKNTETTGARITSRKKTS